MESISCHSYGVKHRWGIVYVFKCEDYMKIGFTTISLYNRLAVAQTHNPHLVEIARAEQGCAAQEAWLHNRYYQIKAPAGNGWYTFEPGVLYVPLPMIYDSAPPPVELQPIVKLSPGPIEDQI